MMLDGAPGGRRSWLREGPQKQFFFSSLLRFLLPLPEYLLIPLDKKNEKSRQPQVTESAQRETGTWGNLVWSELSEDK